MLEAGGHGVHDVVDDRRVQVRAGGDGVRFCFRQRRRFGADVLQQSERFLIAPVDAEGVGEFGADAQLQRSRRGSGRDGPGQVFGSGNVIGCLSKRKLAKVVQGGFKIRSRKCT